MGTIVLFPLLRLCLSLVGLSHLVVTWERVCSDLQVKDILKRCNPDLAAINTAILHTTDGDFTFVCSAFSRYILCVEPKIIGCESILLDEYRESCSVYVSLPYNCSVPKFNVTVTDLYNTDSSSSVTSNTLFTNTMYYWTLFLSMYFSLSFLWYLRQIQHLFYVPGLT